MLLYGWCRCWGDEVAIQWLNLRVNNNPTDIQLIQAHGWFSRLKGLLGTRTLHDNRGIWLKPCNSIHTMGMCYSIDVLFLDEKNSILKIAEQVRPFRFRLGSRHTKSVLELAAGSVEKMGLNTGDTLHFSY